MINDDISHATGACLEVKFINSSCYINWNNNWNNWFWIIFYLAPIITGVIGSGLFFKLITAGFSIKSGVLMVGF